MVVRIVVIVTVSVLAVFGMYLIGRGTEGHDDVP